MIYFHLKVYHFLFIMNMNEKLNEYGVPDFDYFSLVRKSDHKEVYTSLAYTIDNSEALDISKIAKTLNYYFERVNGSIAQQLDSPKFSDEQKQNMKLLNVDDYVIKFKKFTAVGMAEKTYWAIPASRYCVGF